MSDWAGTFNVRFDTKYVFGHKWYAATCYQEVTPHGMQRKKKQKEKK